MRALASVLLTPIIPSSQRKHQQRATAEALRRGGLLRRTAGSQDFNKDWVPAFDRDTATFSFTLLVRPKLRACHARFLSLCVSVSLRLIELSIIASFCRETERLQQNSPARLRRGCGAQRHWGGANRCDPATHLAFPRPFEPPPPWPVAVASPPYSRRGALVPSFATETS